MYRNMNEYEKNEWILLTKMNRLVIIYIYIIFSCYRRLEMKKMKIRIKLSLDLDEFYSENKIKELLYEQFLSYLSIQADEDGYDGDPVLFSTIQVENHTFFFKKSLLWIADLLYFMERIKPLLFLCTKIVIRINNRIDC